MTEQDKYQYEFKVGGSLGENAPSYVVRQADDELYRYLKAGEFCYIFNSRQMGKTSLIVRTQNRLKAEGYACTSLDFSVRGSGDMKSEQWYAGIVYKLVVNFELGNPKDFLLNWWKDRSAISGVERLDEFIETVLLASIKSNIVIFIDEIDSILSLRFPTDDFFALIRSCYEKRNYNPEYRRLTFALVGVATPGDLIGDKRRTPFNIGKAIQLDGFKETEIEPLAKGFEGIVENPLGLMQEVLNWTGGQPFLTQKVCRLLKQYLDTNNVSKVIATTRSNHPEGVDHLKPLENNEKLESIIQTKIIDNWEAHDEPEHLKTIRDRMLLGEQIAGRFLGLYQQILLQGYINADNSLENMRFRLLGLVVKEDRIIKVYNRIYKSVFNLNWVEKELGKLRPYSESFQAWVDSGYEDESRLLRGQALQNALHWANEKNLSNEDARYLSASQELEKQELAAALATQEEEGRILAAANEELKQSQHKSQLANQTLKKAQKKSRRMIRFGAGFLIVTIVLAIVATTVIQTQSKNTLIARLEETATILLRVPKELLSIDSLSDGIRTAREWKNLVKDNYPISSPTSNLQNVLLNIRERNRLEAHQDSVLSVAFSPDGKTLASGSRDNTIKLWDIGTSEVLTTLSAHQAIVTSVAFSPDGKTLASGSRDNTIKLWDIGTSKVLTTFLSAHQDSVLSVAFSHDGKTLASGGYDSTIKLWDIGTSKLLTTFLSAHQGIVTSVAFSPDGKTLATGSDDKTIKLWDVGTSKVLTTLSAHQDTVWSVAFSPDGQTLASGSRDNTIKLWDIGISKVLTTLSAHQDEVFSVAFSPDGQTLASGSADSTIKLWDIGTSTVLTTLSADQQPVISVAFSPDGQTLATDGDSNNIKLWDVGTSKLLTTLLSAGQGLVTNVAFSPDGKTLATDGDSNNIKLWDIGTSKLLTTLSAHQDTVRSVAFSPDGKTLASGSEDSTIKLWDIGTSKVLTTLSAHQDTVRSVAFSPDGKTLASGSEDSTIKLWDIGTSKVLTTLSALSVSSVAFSPDGKTLASGSRDSTIKLWDIGTSKVLTTLSAHRGEVSSVAFSPDGKTLASGSWDSTIRLWNLDLDDLLAKGCEHLEEYLASREELREELCPQE